MGSPSDGTRGIKGDTPLARISPDRLVGLPRRAPVGRCRMPYRLPYRLPCRLPCRKPPADPAVGGPPSNGDRGLGGTANVPASPCSLREAAVGASGQIGTAPLGSAWPLFGDGTDAAAADTGGKVSLLLTSHAPNCWRLLVLLKGGAVSRPPVDSRGQVGVGRMVQP